MANTAVKNFSHAPPSWHEFLGSTDTTKKINLTDFHKAIYDYIDANDLRIKDTNKGRKVTLDKQLASLLKVPELLLEDIQDQVALLANYVIQTKDGRYSFIRDYVLECAPGHEEETLKTFEKTTGIPISKYFNYERLENRDEDMEEDEDEDEDDSWDSDDYDSGPYTVREFIHDLHVRLPYSLGIGESGFAAPQQVTDALRRFMNIPSGNVARMAVTRKVIEYIKTHSLESKQNQRIIIPDQTIESLVGNEETRRLRMQKRKDALLKEAEEDPTNDRKKRKAEAVIVSGELTYFNLQVHLNDCFPTSPHPTRGLRGMNNWDAILDEIKTHERTLTPNKPKHVAAVDTQHEQMKSGSEESMWKKVKRWLM